MGSFELDNPYGINSTAMLMSGTSSGIAYNTTGPNDWIANGSNVGGNQEQLTAPSKIDVSSNESLDILNQFIEWYHYVNETRLTRKDIYPDDVVNWESIPKPRISGRGSTTTYPQRFTYEDSGGKVDLSVMMGHEGLKSDNNVIRHAQANEIGNDRQGRLHTSYEMIMQDRGALVTMQIYGSDLADRIKEIKN